MSNIYCGSLVVIMGWWLVFDGLEVYRHINVCPTDSGVNMVESLRSVGNIQSWTKDTAAASLGNVVNVVFFCCLRRQHLRS